MTALKSPQFFSVVLNNKLVINLVARTTKHVFCMTHGYSQCNISNIHWWLSLDIINFVAVYSIFWQDHFMPAFFGTSNSYGTKYGLTSPYLKGYFEFTHGEMEIFI